MKQILILLLCFLTLSCKSTKQGIITNIKEFYLETDKELTEKPVPLDNNQYQEWIQKNNKHLASYDVLGEYNKVTAVFIVDENGNVTNNFIWKGLGEPYDSEANRLMKENPYKWKVGKINGKPVKVKCYYTINFLKK